MIPGPEGRGALCFRVLGCLLLVLAWQGAAWRSSGLVVAGPLETAQAALALLGDPAFLCRHLLPTLGRVAAALACGVAAGVSLGLAAGFNPRVRHMLAPLRWMLMSVPGVVVVVVFMLWFGMGATMVVAFTAVMIAPLIYVNVVEGLVGVDAHLVEMARVYGFPLGMRLRRIYAVALAGPLLSGVVLATGNCIRVVILAELLGAERGVGYALSVARANLDTPGIYAVALLCMLMVGGVEYGLLGFARKRIREKNA